MKYFIYLCQKLNIMKLLQSTFFRAICAIIIGALLIEYREQTVQWITIAIGILFFLSGIISLAVYYSSRKTTDNNTEVYDSNGNLISETIVKPKFPVVGLGSLILGIILALMPGTFITGLVYIMAAMLILGAISQFIALASASKYAQVGLFYWIMPSIILLVGLISIIYPKAIASAPLFVIGWCMLVYGIVECINTLKIHNCRKQIEKAHNATNKDTETDIPQKH